MSASDWKARRDALAERLKALQGALQAESGGVLDMREYRRRVRESGLLAEWEALQADPAARRDIVSYQSRGK